MAKKKTKGNIVLTARDLLDGYVANTYDYNIYNLTPLQMAKAEEKDEDWKKWNLDWFERAGINQLSKQQNPILKNYNLANGVLDQNDYIIGDGNEYSDMISLISTENSSNLPIKFYPIIPNIVNVLCGEFSKRDSRIIAKAVDETSINEAYEEKKKLLTQILVSNAEQKILEQYQSMGIDLNELDPDQQQQFQQDLDTARQIAEAETKFKSYRGIAEQWANHILQLDNDRFDMYQKEYHGFRDMLVSDREFWHVQVMEDDYKVELWEPWNVFYHKSPDVQYTSEGNYIGRIKLMSIPDIIDIYGSKMTEDQLLQLKNHYRTLNTFPLVTDGMRDQENWYTNYSKPYPQNYTNVTWQKYMDGQVATMLDGKKPDSPVSNMTWYDLNRRGQYIEMDVNGPGMVRVTEVYWKSQKRVGHLTRIDKNGILTQVVVDEGYRCTEDPIYDTSLNKCKSKDNLISGEHIDWIWINEVRWGVKMNSSLASYYTRNYSDFEPIYISGDPLPFQFRSQSNIYGCRLPVEGRIFSDRGSYSRSLVDQMKPNQINYNIVNNQIVEMLADEIGNVVVLDQNMIPRNSLKGQWGKYNFPMFHQVMKDYQVAAIDPSPMNTGTATNFAHFQAVDLTKTNQIMSRLQLAEFFKNEAYAVVGITPQRLGSVTASETATGTQQAVNNSYAQTEVYFDQHMNHLMPRVRQLMLDAAQFITSTKPQARLNYLNSNEENIFFQIEGADLLLRDFKIYAKSTANVKALVERLQQLAMQNNTAGGSMLEIAQMISIQSPAEIMAKLREFEDRRQQEIEAQRQHEMQMQQQAFQQQQEIEREIQEHDDYWKGREIDKEIYIAQIKAMGFGQNQDLDGNGVADVLETEKFLHQQGIDAQAQFTKDREFAFKAQQEAFKANEREKDRQLQREEMASREKLEKERIKVQRMQKKKASK